MAAANLNRMAATEVHRVAEMTLRGASGRLRCRVYWPAPPGARQPPLVFLPEQGDVDSADALARELCARHQAVLLSVPYRSRADAVAVTEWLADHAGELDADPAAARIAGVGGGARLAAEIVRHAAEHGWPPVITQEMKGN